MSDRIFYKDRVILTCGITPSKILNFLKNFGDPHKLYTYYNNTIPVYELISIKEFYRVNLDFHNTKFYINYDKIAIFENEFGIFIKYWYGMFDLSNIDIMMLQYFSKNKDRILNEIIVKNIIE